jgi:hypothetical protein
MARKDLEELFEIVRPGDAVEIRAERDEEVSLVFGGAAEPVVVAVSNPASTSGGDSVTVAAR